MLLSIRVNAAASNQKVLHLPRAPYNPLSTFELQMKELGLIFFTFRGIFCAHYLYSPNEMVHASQSQQPLHPHRVPQQLLRQTKYDHMTTDTPQGHKPSSKGERNLNILQVNINIIKTKLKGLKLLIHDTHYRKPSSPLKQTHPKYITSPLCVQIGFTGQGVG